MFAISLAVIGALDLSFLSCLAYGKLGMTAVILLAEAVLQAFMIIRSSMILSLISPGDVDCKTKTINVSLAQELQKLAYHLHPSRILLSSQKSPGSSIVKP